MKTIILSFVILFFVNTYSQKLVGTIETFSGEITLTAAQREKLIEHIGKLTSELKNSSDKLSLYRSRAMEYLKLKQYTAAIFDFSKAIELDAQDAESFLFRGLCKQASRKIFQQTSCDDFKISKALGYEKVDWEIFKNICPEN